MSSQWELATFDWWNLPSIVWAGWKALLLAICGVLGGCVAIQNKVRRELDRILFELVYNK